MVERFPRPKVATYHVWPDGEARFASCSGVAWSIESGNTGSGTFEVGEDVEVTNDCGAFAAKFAGVFPKEGADCPVVRVEEPPLAYYVLGAWSDAGDGNFPPAIALRPDGRMHDGIRFRPFAAGSCPGALVATPAGERRVEDFAAGDLVLAWNADAVPPTRAGRPTRDGMRPIRAKRIGWQTVSERFRSADRLMPVRFAPGSLGSGMPHSELTIAADNAVLVGGSMREAGTLIDGTTVTRVPPSECGEGCAVHRIETETRANVLDNGAPSETFAANVPCRAFDDLVEPVTPCGRPPETDEPPCPRVSVAGRPASRIENRPSVGAKEETATGESPVDGAGACRVAERATAGTRRPRARDRRCREEAIKSNPAHFGTGREKGRFGRALARIAREAASFFLLGATLAAMQLVLARAADAKVTISDANFPENSGIGWIILGNDGGDPVVINYETKDGTAKQGADYEPVSGSSVDPVVDGSWTLVGIPIIDDTARDGEEHFYLVVNGTDYRVNIHDNEQRVDVTVSRDVFPEDAGTARIRLVNAGESPVVINWSTRDGSATQPADYNPVSGSSTGSVSRRGELWVEIPIVDDAVSEGGEHFFLVVNGTDHRITIEDDELPLASVAAASPATVSEGTASFDFTVNLNSAITETAAVGYRMSGTASLGYGSSPGAGEDYVVAGGTKDGSGAARTDGTGQIAFAPGETSKTLRILINDDDLKELDETIVFELVPSDTDADELAVSANAMRTTLTLLSEDGPILLLRSKKNKDSGVEGAGIEIEARASLDSSASQAGRKMNVNAMLGASGDTSSPDDYPTAGFPKVLEIGENGWTSFHIPFVKDNRQEMDETITVTLTSVADPRHTASKVVTIVDGDWPPILSVSPRPRSVPEGDAAEFQVALNLPEPAAGRSATVELNVGLEIIDTASSADFIAPANTTLTLVEGAPQTVRIPIVDDGLKELDESFTVWLQGTGGTTASRVFSVKIPADDDIATLKLRRPEGGTTDRLRIQEGSGPGDVQAVFEAALDLDGAGYARSAKFRVSVVDGTAKAGKDFRFAEPPEGTILNILEGTPRTFGIEVLDDKRAEGAEYFTIVLDGTENASIRKEFRVYIDDDEPPQVSVAPASPATVTEETARYEFVVNLDGDAGEDGIAVGYRFGGTATLGHGSSPGAGEDYVVAGGTMDASGTARTDGTGQIMFSAGETSMTLAIEIADDDLKELDETIMFELVPSDTDADELTADANAMRTALTLRSDDGPIVVLTPASVRAVEGGTAEFRASLDLDPDPGNPGRSETFDVTLGHADDGASDADYGAPSASSIVLAEGTQRTIGVPIADDDLKELDESFSMILTGRGSPGGTSEAIRFEATIEDDEEIATLKLLRPGGGSTERLRVVEGGESGGGDFVALFEATLNLDGAPDERSAKFRVVANDGAAKAGEDFRLAETPLGADLEIAEGKPGTFGVEVLDDEVREGAEHFDLVLEGVENTVYRKEFRVTIDDDELPGVSVAAASPAAVSEGIATFGFTVNLSEAIDDRAVAVGYRLSGTARLGHGSSPRAGEDYVVAGGTRDASGAARTDGTGQIAFAAGETSKTLMIEIADDDLKELDETIAFELVPSDTSADALTVAPNAMRTLLTLQSEDGPLLVLTPESQKVSEGFAARFRAELDLDADPNNVGRKANILATVGSDGDTASGADYDSSLFPITVKITEGQLAEIVVPLRADNLREPDETLTVALTSASDPRHEAMAILTIGDVTRITDTRVLGSAPTARATVSEGTISEGTATYGFEVELSAPAGASGAALGYRLSGTASLGFGISPGAGEDYVVAGGAKDATGLARMDGTGQLSFAAGETSKTLTIDIRDDDLKELEETIVFELVQSDTNADELTVDANAMRTVLTLRSEDGPVVALSPASRKAVEGAGAAFQATLDLDPDPNNPGRMAMAYATLGAPGDTASPDDYDSAGFPMLVTLAEGTPTDIMVPLRLDGRTEGDETLTVAVTSANDARHRAEATAIIVNSDGPPVMAMTPPPSRVPEGRAVEFEVKLDMPGPASGRSAAFELTVGGGAGDTASADDYVAPAEKILTLVEGTPQTISIPVIDDGLKEMDETFTVALEGTSGAGASRSFVVTIPADERIATLKLRRPDGGLTENLQVREGGDEGGEGDFAAVFEVALDMDLEGNPNPAALGATFNLSVKDGTARAGAGEDYDPGGNADRTLPPLAMGMSHAFAVDILDDDVPESAEHFVVVLQGMSGALFRKEFRVSVEDDDGTDPILREIGRHVVARTEALSENQPRLIPMLRNPAERASEFTLRMSDRGVEAANGKFHREALWGATALSRSTDGGWRHEHLLTTLGAHARVTERLHLGGMLQFDRFDARPRDPEVSGEIGGYGWMAGPYFILGRPPRPLYFEGRLLFGRAAGDVDELVAGEGSAPRSASFDSRRWLVQGRVEGTRPLGGGVILIPLADFSLVRDRIGPFAHGGSPDAPTDARERAVMVGKLQAGAELEIPVSAARGDMKLRPGLRFVFSKFGGSLAKEAGRETGWRSQGRIDFGIDYVLGDNVVLSFESFYSGLGSNELESYGAGLELRMEF